MIPPKKKRSFINLFSPAAKAAYAWVNNPDTKFDPPTYKITILIPEGSEADAFEAAITDAMKKCAEKDGTKLKKGNISIPIKRWEDDDEEKRKPEFQGYVRFSFKSSRKPALKDSRNKDLPEDVYPMSGDVVRVAFGVSAWATPMGSGASCRLAGVQLIEKNNTGSSQTNFEEYEGGFTASDEGDETL